ncbi:MAG: acylneuraminate cytidylyltransferase [Chloroflexota bacterium]|nr:acylneuraminate cytidylyltransferase [Chloroflexota bacterium]
MTVLAIIPARGGSKSIPRKNIKPLCGKPLIAWTIEAAHAAESIGRVVVSTDDDEIATVSRSFGAEVVIRPAEISGDLASSESALLHVLQTLDNLEDYRPEVLAFLQCTSPLTRPEDIDGTVEMVSEGGCDSAATMTPFHFFIWREDRQGQMTGVNHRATQRLMRQEREVQFLEVGAVYAMRTGGFLENRFRFFGRIGKYIIPSSRALEIDEPEDWTRAEALMRATAKPSQFRRRSTRWAKIQAVVTDFDGVMTDNRVRVDQDGNESVVCHRGDGWGISLLRDAGIAVACISTEENPVVRARCEKLGIPYWQGQQEKLLALREFLGRQGIEPANCLYVGNDTNDAGCLDYVGIAVVPRDAASEVVPLADWQTRAAGGEGVLREIASLILEENPRG